MAALLIQLNCACMLACVRVCINQCELVGLHISSMPFFTFNEFLLNHFILDLKTVGIPFQRL